MKVTGLDHVVLIVADVERTLSFYVDTLGLAPERVEEWRRQEVLFPSVRVDDGTVIDIVPGERGDGRGSMDHFCLVVDDLDVDRLTDSGVEIVVGPVERWGARGNAMSVYVSDPDGTVVELRAYPGPR